MNESMQEQPYNNVASVLAVTVSKGEDFGHHSKRNEKADAGK